MDIKTILCPVDFSEFSRHALVHAVTVARWFGSDLTVLYVYPPPVAPPPVVFGGLGAIPPTEPFSPMTVSPERTHDAMLDELSRFVASVGVSGVPLTVHARPGSPAASILHEARDMNAALIVVGTHGHSGFDRVMLGSVTEKVRRKAVCPVLTVPPPVTNAPPEALQLFKRILCGVDFSDASLRALEYALAVAKEADAELIVLHVIEGLPEMRYWKQPPSPAVVEYLRVAEADALARLRSAIPDDARNWCRPEVLLATGKPYNEILQIARQRDAHLIVMGTHGQSPIELMFFGSTASHVGRSASCPVLTVRSAS